MSESSVIKQLKDLRKDLDKESKLLHEQMELPLNGAVVKNSRSDNNSIQLNKGVAFSKWIRKLTSQFESVDPFYK
tara:strand:+ start:316 stop:540 length:225 start_codon:yes stop_codon:yes gene_type:complete